MVETMRLSAEVPICISFVGCCLLSLKPKKKQPGGSRTRCFLKLGKVPAGGLNTPFPTTIATGDFSGDGRLDFATISGSEDTPGLSIVLGNGNGTWVPFSVLPPTGTWAAAEKIVVTDINGDGHPDIVAAIREFHESPLIHYNLHVGSWLGLGIGLFAQPVEYNTTNSDNIIDPYTLAVADFDKDGRPDLIVTVGTDEGVLFYKGNGDGTFQDRVVVISQAQLQSAGLSSLLVSAGAAADIDKDGKMDYVFASDTQVWWAKGNGNGTFQTPALIGSYSKSSSAVIKHVIVGDFDGDGRRDVAVAGQVFLQTSAGHFTLGQQIGWGSDTDMLAATDLNGDGRPDLVTTGPDANHIAVFYTTSGPATQAVIIGGDNQTAVYASPKTDHALT
jgi:hypothetical protein